MEVCCEKMCQSDLFLPMKKYLKIDESEMRKEEYSLKNYIKTLTIPDDRLRFALWAKIMRSFKMIFKGVKSFATENWLCNDCLVPDTQEHLMECPAFSSFRVGKDLQTDKNLVDYFRQIILLRSSDCSGT